MKGIVLWNTMLFATAMLVVSACGEKMEKQVVENSMEQSSAEEEKKAITESNEKQAPETGNGTAKSVKPKEIIPQVIPPEPRPPYYPEPDPYEPYYYDPVPGPPVVEPVPPKDEPVQFADPMPEFPGGNEALQKFMANNIRYPQVCMELDIQGKVYVRFVVNTDGSIVNVEVLRGIKDCLELDKEAIRFVKSMPNWTPGMLNGKPIKAYMTLPIRFHLE
jgi:TonB family protein